jgi:hypothetical protein
MAKGYIVGWTKGFSRQRVTPFITLWAIIFGQAEQALYNGKHFRKERTAFKTMWPCATTIGVSNGEVLESEGILVDDCPSRGRMRNNPSTTENVICPSIEGKSVERI